MKEQQETLATVAGKTESTVERCEMLENHISCEDPNSYIISERSERLENYNFREDLNSYSKS